MAVVNGMKDSDGSYASLGAPTKSAMPVYGLN